MVFLAAWCSAHQGEHFLNDGSRGVYLTLVFTNSSPYTNIVLSFLNCSTECLSLVILSEFLEPSQDPPLWEVFIGKNCLQNAAVMLYILLSMMCGLTVRGGADIG